MDAQNRPQPKGEPYVGYKSRFGPTWQELYGTSPAPAFPPPPQTPPPTATQVGRREIAEVEAIIANIEQKWATWPESAEDPYEQACRDVFLWALGCGRAPATQVSGPPDLAALRAEDDAAYQQISRPSRRQRDYWVPVQHGTMWLLGETDTHPWLMIEF